MNDTRNILRSEALSSISELTSLSPTVSIAAQITQLADAEQNLPLANTQSGNLFRDRFATDLFWYLPAFELAADPDPAFRFAATQSGVDSSGNPFNRASLTLSLQKGVPSDVGLAQAQNPAATFREIALTQFTVILSTTSKDANGVDQQNTYTGAVNVQPNGSIQATFENLLGPGVIIAYQNLAHDGGAQIALSASYEVWRLVFVRRRTPPIWSRPLPSLSATATIPVQSRRLAQLAAPSMVSNLIRLDEAKAMPLQAMIAPPRTVAQTPIAAEFVRAVPPDDQPDDPEDRSRYIQSSAYINMSVALGQKYTGAAYTRSFTIADDGIVRPIISVNDLRNYDVQQSEFTEFHGLGDISSKYPSFSRLYVGVLSRTIIAVPARYGIIRGSAGCAAVCQALLDSSPAQPSKCRFQFAFLLGPAISSIDLLQLSQDLRAYPGLKDYQLQLPSQLDSRVDAMLVTPFKSACIYTDGSSPHTFALAIEIRDDQLDSPAVANANLFIKQLSAAVQPYLVGRFGINLDDYYPTPIMADVVLNFSVTSGTDDLGFRVDESQQSVMLVNGSPLDLQISRYASSTPGNLTITPLQQALMSQQTIPLPLPSDRSELNVIVDRTLALEQPLTKQHLGRYLAFQTQDVQEIQYDLGINASGVNFKARGISLIKVQISFADLPNLAVPALTLAADHTLGSARIVVPVEYAISTLAATLEFTVQLTAVQQSPLSFTRANDFIDYAIFVLRDADLSGAGLS
jgi:hypothetical protein